ncbi:uncharacterized protein LOC131929453 [Physella acuta]|uniref:uncharacterized protein LOC131929453 n=1 Tax=Physella acuta TaxID=109671 RepID=UPI0027DDC436|nr:uncharacterized protein LOC131929453 [Physella acuta]XP_059141656.1 uncharacterized protein LOC131929453 [Physella acuta]XP_059141657.1 uncharacterized protein LOC131929453 [Physella acuta]XP_059141658.1 uncharacterized protein LOC131929453 [Physella acuta]
MSSALIICQDGEKQSLNEWLKIHGDRLYPGVGTKTWRVPPVRFHNQKIVCEKSYKSFKILEKPAQTDQETNCAENIVCGAFEKLSDCLVRRRDSAMFLVSNFEYDNYLNKIKIPTELPKDVAKRGELDILILHQKAGILLVQTKAVGYNFPKGDSLDDVFVPAVQKAIEKAGDQLSRDRRVMLHVMQDLYLTSEQMISIVALPNLPRRYLEQALLKCPVLKNKIEDDFKLKADINFLCEEDFRAEDYEHFNALEKWWTEKVTTQANSLDLETMKQIAYRTVGLLSTVSVWSHVHPRMEVRDLNDAAWETGNRYTQVILSRDQVNILNQEHKYFYLWGPAGSGKTLLLSLKGRQWLRKDYQVIILNTRLGSKGRTVGHVMESQINKTQGLSKTAVRVDIDLVDDTKTLIDELKQYQATNSTVRFLIDEVTWVPETEELITLLKKYFPLSAIWCAGLLQECQPKDFQSEQLLNILRCPPSVQRVLRLVDNREDRCGMYHLNSSKAGLPTDGPAPYFIIHSRHGSPGVQPYDCKQCAQDLSDFLLNHLNMKDNVRNIQADNISTPTPKSAKDGPKTIPSAKCGGRLHFNDAVLAVSMPQSWHHPTDRGYWAISREALHWNMLLLGSGKFCTFLLDHGIPLRVEGAMTFTPDGTETNNSFAMCPIGSVHGLEYKVVVCMPSACDLPQNVEINTGIVQGQKEPIVKMRRLKFAEEIMQQRKELLRQGLGFCTCFLKRNPWHRCVDDSKKVKMTGACESSLEPKSDKIRISTHVHGDYQLNTRGIEQPRDLLYEEVESAENQTKCSVGDILVSPVTPEKNDEVDTNIKQIPVSTEHTPDKCLQKLKQEICGQCDTSNCVCKYFRKRELVALHRLDPWDKAYVLMCASRCTSQLILVLP